METNLPEVNLSLLSTLQKLSKSVDQFVEAVHPYYVVCDWRLHDTKNGVPTKEELKNIVKSLIKSLENGCEQEIKETHGFFFNTTGRVKVSVFFYEDKEYGGWFSHGSLELVAHNISV